MPAPTTGQRDFGAADAGRVGEREPLGTRVGLLDPRSTVVSPSAR
ncbi:hypothetical protein [Williamsia sp. M5A3_1d]